MRELTQVFIEDDRMIIKQGNQSIWVALSKIKELRKVLKKVQKVVKNQ
jgi:hypothetical protein